MADVPFVITFHGRQGSTHLQHLLDSHPDVRCYGELLHPGARFDRSGQTLHDFVVQMIHMEPVKAAGFKIGWFNIEKHPDILDIMEHYNYRIILLTRNNKLDQYISMLLAQANNIWTSDQGEYSITSLRSPPEISVEQSLASFEKTDQKLTELTVRFARISVKYEDLSSPTIHTTICEFLGVEPIPLISTTKRQRQGSQRDALANYDTLKHHFADTKWGKYFID